MAVEVAVVVVVVVVMEVVVAVAMLGGGGRGGGRGALVAREVNCSSGDKKKKHVPRLGADGRSDGCGVNTISRYRECA